MFVISICELDPRGKICETADVEAIEYYRLAKEIRSEVARLHRAVERGECVSEAIRFTKFLVWSGLVSVLRKAPEAGHLTVDGALLEWEVSELSQLAMRCPETRRVGTYEERVLKNLESIAGAVSKLTGASGNVPTCFPINVPGGNQ